MTKLPAAFTREIQAEFKIQRYQYVADYISSHLTDVFSISDFYPVVLIKLQTAIQDGYEIAEFDRQPFYNIGDPAMRIVMNKKPQEIDTERRSLTEAAEAALMASLEAQAEELYQQMVAEEERRKRAAEAAKAAAEAEALTFSGRLRASLVKGSHV